MSEPEKLSKLTFIPLAVRRKLRLHGFSTSADLLRTSTSRLAKRLGNSVTIADVDRWQSVCSALEIENMTLPWARVLGEQGPIAAPDLARRNFSKVTELFAAAKQRGDIAVAPDSDAIAAMMVDSALIGAGGVLNATIRDRSDRPVKGALVQCAHREAKSDTHGRVRMTRLPLGAPVEVSVAKAGFVTLTRRIDGLAGPSLLEVRRFSMHRGRKAKERTSKRVLSEYRGDIVPVTEGQRVRLIEIKNRRLRKGDVLHLYERLKSGPVKLSSRYKESRGGEVSVPVWRLPSNAIPAGATTGSDYLVLNGALVPIVVTARRLASWRIARRVAAEAKTSGPLTTRVNRALKEYIKLTRGLGRVD